MSYHSQILLISLTFYFPEYLVYRPRRYRSNSKHPKVLLVLQKLLDFTDLKNFQIIFYLFRFLFVTNFVIILRQKINCTKLRPDHSFMSR